MMYNEYSILCLSASDARVSVVVLVLLACFYISLRCMFQISSIRFASKVIHFPFLFLGNIPQFNRAE